MATTTESAAGAVHVAEELKRPYVAVLGLLAVVTVGEVFVPNLGRWYGIGGNVQILLLAVSSVAKASLVALYYMHLKYEPRILRWLPVGPLAFVILLVLVVTAH